MPFIEDLKKKAQEWAKRQAEKLKQSTIYHLPGAIAETIEKPRETFERIFAPKQIEREAQRIQKTGKVSMPRLFVEELAKETAATAIDIGKELAKTPLKIGAEIGSRFLGGEYAKTQPAFKIPGLGEITTYTADYHQRKKEFKEKHGLSEKEATIASLLMTGGEAILDATLIASMAAKAAAPKLPALEEKIKSWYVLGQPKTIDEAKETYTQLAHQLHPDMPTGDETAFKTIQKAFETLNKKGIPNVIERAASKIFRPLVQAAYAPIREFGKPIEIPQLPLAQLPGYAEEQIMPVPMAGTIKKKIPVGKEIIKLPRVEEIAEKLGIKIIRTKSRGDTLKIQLTKLPGDKYAIKIPQNLNINSPEVQYSLWHEIGHFIDNAAYVGKNQLVSIVQRGKYSTPHSELLRKFKDYIIKHKPIKPQLTITVPKVGKFRNLEEIERADLPPEIKIKVREAWEKWIKKIENYLMQDIELFADGFARYIQNRDLMKKEAPELVKIYDEILEKEPILKTIFKKIPIETPPDIKPIVDDFLSIVKDLRKTRRLQEKLYTAERSRRLKEILKIRETSKGLESFYRELGALKGPLPHLPPEELTKIISPERAEKLRNYIDALFDYIVKHPALNEWEKIPAREALLKLMGERGGGLPTKSELKYLKRVFGNEFVKNVLEMRSTINKTLDAIVEVAGLPKAFIAAGDISATFRQALPLIYKKEFWANIPEQIKYFFSQRTFENAMKEIPKRPLYKYMELAKIDFTFDPILLTDTEEQYISQWAKKIPWIKASDRAFTGFLNKLRADLFESLFKQAKAMNYNIEEDINLLRQIGEFVNAATGRGDLGRLTAAGNALATVLFSPRLMASRLYFLNPVNYVKAHPFVRREMLKSLLAMIATGTTILASIKAAADSFGWKNVKIGLNPASADFGKVIIDNIVRVDLWGGFQQYIRTAYQLLTGQYVSSLTGVPMYLGEGYKPMTRWDILTRFFEFKEAPIVSFVRDILQGKTQFMEEFNIGEEIKNLFLPLVWQDIWEIAKTEPQLIPIGLLGLTGIGIQTYEIKPTEKEKELVEYMKGVGLSEKQIKNLLIAKRRFDQVDDRLRVLLQKINAGKITPEQALKEAEKLDKTIQPYLLTEEEKKIYKEEGFSKSLIKIRALAEIDKFKTLSPEEKKAEWERIKQDKELLKTMFSILKEKERYTPQEKFLKSLPTKTRALILKKTLENLSPEERKKMWEEYKEKRIITKDVMDHLYEMIKK